MPDQNRRHHDPAAAAAKDEYTPERSLPERTAHRRAEPEQRTFFQIADPVRKKFRKKQRHDDFRILRRLNIAHAGHFDPAVRTVDRGKAEVRHDQQQKNHPHHPTAPAGNTLVAEEQYAQRTGSSHKRPLELFQEIGGTIRTE